MLPAIPGLGEFKKIFLRVLYSILVSCPCPRASAKRTEREPCLVEPCAFCTFEKCSSRNFVFKRKRKLYLFERDYSGWGKIMDLHHKDSPDLIFVSVSFLLSLACIIHVLPPYLGRLFLPYRDSPAGPKGVHCPGA